MYYMPQPIRRPELLDVNAHTHTHTRPVSLQCLIQASQVALSVAFNCIPPLPLDLPPHPFPNGWAKPRPGRRDSGQILASPSSAELGGPVPASLFPRLSSSAPHRPHLYAIGVKATSNRAAPSFHTLVYAARNGRARFPNAACAASARPSGRPARLYAPDVARPRWRRSRRPGWRRQRGRRPWRQRRRQP